MNGNQMRKIDADRLARMTHTERAAHERLVDEIFSNRAADRLATGRGLDGRPRQPVEAVAGWPYGEPYPGAPPPTTAELWAREGQERCAAAVRQIFSPEIYKTTPKVIVSVDPLNDRKLNLDVTVQLAGLNV